MIDWDDVAKRVIANPNKISKECGNIGIWLNKNVTGGGPKYWAQVDEMLIAMSEVLDEGL